MSAPKLKRVCQRCGQYRTGPKGLCGECDADADTKAEVREASKKTEQPALVKAAANQRFRALFKR
jgi:uncharacterized OB-fold protein